MVWNIWFFFFWGDGITCQAINVVWAPKRWKYPLWRLKFWNFFVFSPPAQGIQTCKELPASYEVELRLTKNVHRCIPLVGSVTRICLSSNPTYLLFKGPSVKCDASCWNQLVQASSYKIQAPNLRQQGAGRQCASTLCCPLGRLLLLCLRRIRNVMAAILTTLADTNYFQLPGTIFRIQWSLCDRQKSSVRDTNQPCAKPWPCL